MLERLRNIQKISGDLGFPLDSDMWGLVTPKQDRNGYDPIFTHGDGGYHEETVVDCIFCGSAGGFGIR